MASTVRPEHDGRYQDLYLFAYGRDYARGLRDLRTLTGAAPLLPRKAFGVWFSRWWPYAASDWRALVERFRAEHVPLDTISVDTDFKKVHDPTGAQVASTAVGRSGRAVLVERLGLEPRPLPGPLRPSSTGRTIRASRSG